MDNTGKPGILPSMEQLAWIESTGFSIWIREAGLGFPFFGILTAHTIGMGVLFGTGAAIALRVLGFAPGISLQLLPKLMPIMYVALVVTVISGLLLLTAYPSKALTNPIFYVKLAFAASAFLLNRTLARGPSSRTLARFSNPAAILSLVLWVSTVTLGKLLEYSYTVLLI